MPRAHPTQPPVAAVVLTALLLAGCGATTPSAPATPTTTPPPPATTAAPAAPPAEWTGAVCTAVQPVVDALTTPPALDLRDLAGTRQAYLDYLATADQRAGQAVTDIQAAGAPAVPGGDAVATQVADQLGQMRHDVEQARTRLEQTDTNDVASLGDAVASTGNVVGSLANSAQALGAIRADPQLGPAFDQAPACASLRGRG